MRVNCENYWLTCWKWPKCWREMSGNDTQLVAEWYPGIFPLHWNTWQYTCLLRGSCTPSSRWQRVFLPPYKGSGDISWKISHFPVKDLTDHNADHIIPSCWHLFIIGSSLVDRHRVLESCKTQTKQLHPLWSPEIQCRIHKGSRIIPILSQINKIPSIDISLFKIHSNIALISTHRIVYIVHLI